MKYIKVIQIFVVTICCLSCQEWLDISPETQVKSEDLLLDEEGCFNAVSGIFNNMSSTSLYGTQLTMSFTDILGQYYAFDDADAQSDISNHKFELESTKSIIDGIWSDGYNVIANCNNLIENIDKLDEGALNENVKMFVKAQALGARGLMHFDLVRLFHLPYAMNKDFVAIPYVVKLEDVTSPQLSTQQVINKVLEDLLAAHAYLQKSDPLQEGNSQDGFDRLYDSRVYLNYYSVSALLARVYLYMGDHLNALKYAQMVLGKYSFVDQSQISSNNDYLFENEVIFGLYKERIHEITRKGIFSLTHSNLQGYTPAKLEALLYANADIRLKYWIEKVEENGGVEYSVVKKYWRSNEDNNSDDEDSNIKTLKNIPLIKYGEVVLIAAEAIAIESSVSEGVAILNQLRKGRGLEDIVIENLDQFMDEIMVEYRREFYGEGQTFYMHKRFMSSTIDFRGSEVELNESNYYLPIPDDEVLYGGRKKN